MTIGKSPFLSAFWAKMSANDRLKVYLTGDLELPAYTTATRF